MIKFKVNIKLTFLNTFDRPYEKQFFSVLFNFFLFQYFSLNVLQLVSFDSKIFVIKYF